jgi:chromosomal replication initiation ATPase DnaA
MEIKLIKIVCDHFGIKRWEIDSKSRRRDTQLIVKARQVAAYMLWSYTVLTGQQIAEMLGYEKRQNVRDALNKINEVASADMAFRAELEMIESKVKRK